MLTGNDVTVRTPDPAYVADCMRQMLEARLFPSDARAMLRSSFVLSLLLVSCKDFTWHNVDVKVLHQAMCSHRCHAEKRPSFAYFAASETSCVIYLCHCVCVCVVCFEPVSWPLPAGALFQRVRAGCLLLASCKPSCCVLLH